MRKTKIKKIVFFLQTEVPVSNDQKIFIDLAAYMADNTDLEVSYVNNYHETDFMFRAKSSLNCVSIDEFVPEAFKEAVFFAPVNYLCNLLSLIKDYPDIKICLLSYSAQSVIWLANAVGDLSCSQKLRNMIISSECCAYSNYNSVLNMNNRLDYRNEIFLPRTLSEKIKHYKPVPIINNNEINIAYYGDIDKNLVFTIKNILHNLTIQNIQKPINFHFIGKMGELNIPANFKEASSGCVRFIYTGNLNDPDDAADYIRKNADIIFAADNKAIEAAQYGVPVVIPVLDSSNFIGNSYVWLFDANQYIYRWSASALQHLNNDCYTLKRVIEYVYDKEQKIELAQKCYDFIKESVSLECNAVGLMKLIEKTTLTVSECLSQENIWQCMQDFSLYADIYEKNFNNFLKYRKNGVESVKSSNENCVKKNVLDDKNKKFISVQKSYKRKILAVRRSKRIKVAFLVVFDTTFPTRPVFEKMMNSTLFDPYIIVIPNVFHSMKYQIELYNKTFETLTNEYGNRVIGGYNIKTDEYLELHEEYGIVFFCNPYKALVHPLHDIEYFIDKKCLTVYANYGFAAVKYWSEVINTDFYNYLWKVCVETKSNLRYLEDTQSINGVNGVVTGYLKMDQLSGEAILERSRKMIMICPHHTVTGWAKLDISNFLRFSEFFIRLPQMYPEIDFVFRPHPLLFTNLIEHKLWSQNKLEDYIKRLTIAPNMIYDTSGYYLDKFANSDAMIHDCASFIAEYLYTEKPCCYMMKSKTKTIDELIPFGQKCMENYYYALTEKDIISFIDEVIIKGNDPKKEQRENFAKNELKINYPNTTEFIIDYIAKALKRKNY